MTLPYDSRDVQEHPDVPVVLEELGADHPARVAYDRGAAPSSSPT